MLIVLMKIIAQTICPFYGGKSSKRVTTIMLSVAVNQVLDRR